MAASPHIAGQVLPSRASLRTATPTSFPGLVISLSFFSPPPEDFHVAERNADGTLRGRIDPADTKKREAKLKSDMEKYFARSAEAQEKLRRSAAGIKEETTAPAPKDELALIEMNFLAQPGLLQGKGAVPLQMLTEDQKRSQRRASLDAQAAKAQAHLNKVLTGDSGFDFETYQGISDERIESILNSDEDEDDSWMEESMNDDLSDMYGSEEN
jgi:hypothetical protein